MIRHGETQANAARIMAGHLDSPLTAKGRQQALEAQKVVSALQNKPVAIFHSHLSRARETATIINEALNAPMHEDPDLAEIYAGDWEGATYEVIAEMFDGWPDVPNGESHIDFFQRVKQGKTRALNRFNDPVLIVCHGGVMRAFGEIHGIPTPGKFQNAHLYEFVPKPENPKFPWAIYDYRLCPKLKTLLKSESTIYQI
ncbi:MAG: histidine phosphatase family protein [Alphaproteobacteria bacterium]|nr:histidine phosphatase family protein [Alphaproteobacteria bacterium]